MDDAPIVTEDTESSELREYALKRSKNPIEINGCTVYNYSSHVPDHDALDEKTEETPDGEYIIPFQVTSGWSYIWTMLPGSMKRSSDFLIYITHEGRYSHYPNFYNSNQSRQDSNLKTEHEIAMDYYDR